MGTLNIVGVSSPRSGHHALEAALRAVLQDRLGYCSEFAHGRCCGTLPCVAADGPYYLTKSHDYDLTLPDDLAGALYLVQDREPVGRVLSTVELVRRNRGGAWPIESREFASWWLAKEALYSVSFRRKWVSAPKDNWLVLEYDAFAADPATAVGAVLDRLGWRPAAGELEARVASATAETAGQRRPFQQRDRGRSEILPPDLVADFADVVLRRVPAFEAASPMPAAPTGELEPLYALAAGVRHMGRDEACQLALREARTGNRYFLFELADRLEQLKALEEAYDLLGVLAERSFLVEKVLIRRSVLAEMLQDPQAALGHARDAFLSALQPSEETLRRLDALEGRPERPPGPPQAGASEDEVRNLPRAGEPSGERLALETPPWRIDGAFQVRGYIDRESYVRHQASKFEGWNLDRYHRGFKATLEARLAPLAPLAAVRSVLCLGARTGAECEAFAALGKLALGVDLNPGRSNASVVAGDFHALQFADGVFDAVFSNSLDHALDLPQVLQEAARVLADGGLFIAEAPRGLDEGWRPGPYKALAWRRQADLFALFGAAGFVLLESHPFNVPWNGVQAIWRKARPTDG